MIQFINDNCRIFVIFFSIFLLIFLFALGLDLWLDIELASWVRAVCAIILITVTIIQIYIQRKAKRSRVQIQYNQTYKVIKLACCRLDNALKIKGKNRRQRSITTGYIKGMKESGDLPEELNLKFGNIKVELETLNNEINKYFPKGSNVALKDSTRQVLIMVIDSWIELSEIAKGFGIKCKPFPAAKCSNLMKDSKIREKVKYSESVHTK